MEMTAGRWDMLASQMSWIMTPAGENPFVIKPPVKIVKMKAGEIARILFKKVGH